MSGGAAVERRVPRRFERSRPRRASAWRARAARQPGARYSGLASHQRLHARNPRSQESRPVPDFHLSDHRHPHPDPSSQNSQEHEPPSLGEMKIADFSESRGPLTPSPPLGPDRIPSPPGAAHRMHRARPGGHSARPFVEKRRQVQRICPDNSARLSLLFDFFDWSFVRETGTSLARCRRLARRLCVSRGRSFSALAIGAAADRTNWIPSLVSGVKHQHIVQTSKSEQLDGRILTPGLRTLRNNADGPRREQRDSYAWTVVALALFNLRFPTILDDYVLRGFALFFS